MSAPQIQTAMPKRRYQLGEFVITVLGEVESGDGHDYQWIFAVATEAEPQPGLFVCAERTGPEERGEGRFRMRVAMAEGSQVVGYSDRWENLEPFVEEATRVITTMLDLGDEVPYRLK